MEMVRGTDGGQDAGDRALYQMQMRAVRGQMGEPKIQVRYRKRGACVAKQGDQNGGCRSERTYGSEHAHDDGRR